MAGKGPRLRLRFRKSFPILGDKLKWTISKKGVSLNARLGPMSKSWGTRGTSTTVDAPGAMGLFWRKQTGRASAPKSTGDADADRYLGTQARQRRCLQAALMLLAGGVAVGALRMYNPLSDCEPAAHAGLTLLALAAGSAGAVLTLRSMGVRGLGLVLAAVALCWVQWKLLGALILDERACPAPQPAAAPAPGPVAPPVAD